MSIESDERRQLDGRGASMIDRKPFENGSNPGREREEAVLRGVSGWLEPLKPWLARRNGISSAFRSRHMGNVGSEDLSSLTNLRDVVLWGVPLYAPGAGLHDELVGKEGAYVRLLQTLGLLRRAGAMVELRTVVMQPNLGTIPRLASFIAAHLRWIARWAIMQMECRGYARLHWQSLFVDTSRQFAPIAAAIRIAEIAEFHVSLFNFPRCTVPPEYRGLAERSISDWKRRYLPVCETCTERAACAGFFQWHPSDYGFEGLVPL
jgi:hypothetical protein